MKKVARVSEQRGPFGGVTADGMINVLGRPRLDSLELVLREAGQNAWDARQRHSDSTCLPQPLAFNVRMRTLTASQENFFRELFSDPASDVEHSATNELWKLLSSREQIRVLELCDFGTSGLSGPIDQQGAVNVRGDNFRNFFFDIGVEHFASGDGGTYGYGRSALYLAGRSRTILVHSLVAGSNGSENRFLACRVGHPFERKDFSGRTTRFTGRHFWGVHGSDNGVEPVTGQQAETLAAGLGMPGRAGARTGTSILIPWPASDRAEGLELDGPRVWDALLCHLWPKMVSRTGSLAMHLSVEEQGRTVPEPNVHQHPVYGLLASALLVARQRDGVTGARKIELQRPHVVTGSLALEVGGAELPFNHRGSELEGPGLWYSKGMQHVALMRPSELVVRYLEVPNARQDGRQWAGVFICDDAPDVRDAFARSEPPAHDDWVPDRIDDKYSRRLVYQTVNKYIPDSVRTAFDTGIRPTEAAKDVSSLASAADAFARQFFSGEGTAPAPLSRERRASGNRRRQLRLGRPTLVGLNMEDRWKVATYRLEVSGVPSIGIDIRASAAVAMDGGSVDDAPVGLEPPQVLGWRLSSNDSRLSGGIRLDKDRDILIDVAFMGDYGITLICTAETEP